MRIGLVCPYDITKNGGVQEVLKALAYHFNKSGHKTTIIAPKPRRFKGKAPKNVVLIGSSRNVKALQTTSQVSVSFEPRSLSEMLEKEKFDVLNYHEPWVPILARQILARSSATNIATFHAKMPDGVMIRTIERVITPYTKTILKNFKIMTAVSDSAADYVRTLTKQPINIIPNGIELEKYKQPNKVIRTNKTGKQIFYVGRLEKRKGVLYLIKAYAQLKQRHQDFSLLIAGDGPERKRLEAYIKSNNIQDVKFLGFVSQKKKVQLLHTSDLFCSPAIHGESFGIVLIEAMAAGCVTVAGNNPGYESVMTGDGQISLANPKDTQEFARRLEIMLLNQQIRENWQSWASEEVKKYDYSNIAAMYLKAYESAMLAKD